MATCTGGNTLGSAIYSTLELASGSSTGTIVNVGTFTDFGRIALDAGASWSLGGSIVAGETIAFGGANASLILASPVRRRCHDLRFRRHRYHRAVGHHRCDRPVVQRATP